MIFIFLYEPPTTEISPLSLHDALPISAVATDMRYGAPLSAPVGISAGDDPRHDVAVDVRVRLEQHEPAARIDTDRKSTRLNSSHPSISYAVFCLKKKNKNVNNLHDYTS